MLKYFKYLNILFLVIIFINGCDIDSYVPDKSPPKRWLPEICQPEYNFEGKYANADVDCFIYIINKNKTSSSINLINEIENKLIENKWIKRNSEFYYRFKSQGKLENKTFEIIRIDNLSNSSVLLGFVQADNIEYKNIDQILKNENEMKWAKKNFWPRYEKILKEKTR